jgi:lipopolysaccharide transport system permease protein
MDSLEEQLVKTPPAIAVAGESTAAHLPVRPLTIIEPRGGWRNISWKDLWAYRELLYFLVWRDIMVRYKQTVLGIAWAVLQPLATTIVFSIFFGRVGGLEDRVDVPYPVFTCAGLLPWIMFAAGITQASLSLVVSSHLITKIYFPRLLIPFSAAGVSLIDFMIGCCLIFILIPCYGMSFTLQLLWLPPLTALTLLASLGVGTLLSALTAAYRDFRYVVPFMVQLWMLASPIAYPLELIPPAWRLAYALNPMAGLIGGFRAAFLGQQMPWGPLGISVLSAIFCFIVGTYYFNSVERRFADIV